jgi:ATP-binding protein involved in chromosome partitioning
MLFSRPSTPDTIQEALRGLVDPSMIGAVQIDKDGQAIVTLEIDPAKGEDFEALRQAVEHKVTSLKGVKKALVILTAERKPPALKQRHKAARLDVPGVKKIIAVASGKGGVGKSTVAANLAVALSRMGQRVGLLDADIYGPSVPRLMGISGQKPGHGDDSRIIPLTAHGLKIMSMGFLVDEDTPMIWRGPMVQSAIQQLLRDVAWAELDILVIDMPPGTGDAQLTLAQKVQLAGAVIVSTPQDIALIDARKGLEMFRKVAVPVLGIVENMSYYCCPECGHRADIFGHGGAREQAEKVDCPFLGEVPLHADIRRLSDEGLPITVADPSSPQAQAFQDIAHNVLAGLETASRPAPQIIIDE